MNIGFTGTQRGMTPEQYAQVVQRVVLLGETTAVNTAHHGDCIGADADFHRIIRTRRTAEWLVTLHPPDNDSKRAFCDYDTLMEPLPYLERNKEIVKASVLLIATPGEDYEVLRSGTWMTIRRAVALKADRIVIGPSGATLPAWSTLLPLRLARG